MGNKSLNVWFHKFARDKSSEQKSEIERLENILESKLESEKKFVGEWTVLNIIMNLFIMITCFNSWISMWLCREHKQCEFHPEGQRRRDRPIEGVHFENLNVEMLMCLSKLRLLTLRASCFKCYCYFSFQLGSFLLNK